MNSIIFKKVFYTFNGLTEYFINNTQIDIDLFDSTFNAIENQLEFDFIKDEYINKRIKYTIYEFYLNTTK